MGWGEDTGPSRQAGGCEDDAQSHHEHRVHKIMPGTEIFHITNNFIPILILSVTLIIYCTVSCKCVHLVSVTD